jgi:hypothetical protein
MGGLSLCLFNELVVSSIDNLSEAGTSGSTYSVLNWHPANTLSTNMGQLKLHKMYTPH